jgi:hypothetical protein
MRRYVDPDTGEWWDRSGRRWAVNLGPGVPGFVTYTPAEISAWQANGSGDAEYTAMVSRLASANDPNGNPWGGTTRTIPAQSATFAGLRDSGNTFASDCMYAKMMALRWCVEGNTAHRNKVLQVIAVAEAITSIPACTTVPPVTANGNIRLNLIWAITNIVEAAYLIGYTSANFERFLRIAYQGMDWRQAVNWDAGAAHAKVAIAVFLKDDTMWADSVAYTNVRLGQGVHHPTYDLGHIKPKTTEYWPQTVGGTPSASFTSNHWYLQVVASPWNAEIQSAFSQTAWRGWDFPAGWNGEAVRDPGHEGMSIGGFGNALRTIRGNGGSVTPESHARYKAFVTVAAARVLYYIDHANTQSPSYPQWSNPPSVSGDTVYRQQWMVAATYLGDEAPADLITLLGRSSIVNSDPCGYNWICGERFAEGSLL